MSERTVLVVDDESSQRKVLSGFLRKRGFVTLSAESVDEALELAGANVIDIVLTDLNLPDSRGIETMKRLSSAAPNIPVVILTSSKEEGDRAMSYDVGANSFLVKPVSFEGFLDVVRKIGDYWFSLNVGPPVSIEEPGPVRS